MRSAFLVAVVLALVGPIATADVTYLDTFTGELQYPGRLAPTAGGGVYVTDQPVGQIVEFDAAGAVVATYSIPELPVGIAADLASGNIYVARGDGQVGIYDATFTLLGTLDPTPFTLTRPNDLTVDPLTGEVYVVESAEQMIMVFDGATGGLLRVWGTEGSDLSELMHPQAIALDPALGHVIVADADNFRVQVFDTMGVLQFKFGYRILFLPDSETGWFARAEGLAVDACSNIYITDAVMGTVRVFDEAGTELDPDHLPVVGFGSGPGELQVPCDVLIDGGTMYVADTNGAAVEVYSVSCTPLPLGSGHDGISGQGKHSGKKTKFQAVPAHAKATPTIPDNPFEIIEAMEAGEYVRDLDLNRDRSIDIADLEIALEGFGGADAADFLEKDWEFTRNSYDPPHIIDLPYACGRCHAINQAPGGMLTAWGQENLCLSCHSSGKIALGTPIGGASAANSHPWGVAADSGDVVGPDPDSELALHLDDGDVRCGTCHEPHELGEGDYLRAPIDRGQLCGECHTETAGWLHAGHADEEGEAFVHYDWTQPNRASCRRCHSGYGFIDFSAGLPDAEQRGDFRVLDCVVCHATHGSSEPDLLRVYDEVVVPDDVNLTDVGASATCLVCHNGRRTPGGSSLTPHYLLGGVMWLGINGAEFGAILENSSHTSVADCTDCHMAPSPAEGQPGAGKVGGHSFNMVVHDEDDPDYGFENVENACNSAACHGNTGALTVLNRTAYGDYDGNGTIEGVQDEVEGLLELVLAATEAAGAVHLEGHPYWDVSGVDPDILQTVRDAIWNYEYVSNDGSLGIHNTGYTVGLLQASYEALTGAPVPDADLRYLPPGFGPTIVEITSVNGGNPVEVGGAFTVDFTVEDDLGNPIAMADLDRLRLYVSGPTYNYQRVIEVDGNLSHYVQNGDGSYTYTAVDPFPSVYAPPENDSPAFGPDDGEMTGEPLVEGTYTVLIESRRVFGSIRKAGDDTFDFVVADDPLSPPDLEPRQFVLREKCNDCHNDIQLHGGGRFAVAGCVLCHTSGSEDLITDPETTPGVTVKFGEMIHKIHRSSDLPNVVATANGADPYRYEIIGHGESVNDFSDIGFPIIPMGVMDCDACHGDAAQGPDINTNATQANCTSCHDDLDFATGTILDWSNPDVQGGLLSEGDLDDPAYRVNIGHTWADGTCMGCHGSESPLGVEVIHQHPTTLEQEGTFPTIEVVDVGGMTGGGGMYFIAGDYPEVTFRLTDVNNDPLELVDGDATVIDRIEMILAGPTTLYQMIIGTQRPWSGGSLAVDPANWTDNFAVDGTYTFTFEDPLPAEYPPQLNSIGEPPADQIFSFEGGWGQQYTPAGTPLDDGTYTVFAFGRRVTAVAGEREPILSDQFDVLFGADVPVTPYSGTVDTASCNACHGRLALHGNQREGVLTCLACHTAGTQDGGTYESVDLRIMVHKLHNARNLTNLPYGLAGHSGIMDFSLLLISSMPGEAAECHVCHVTDDWKSPPLRPNMRTWMVVCTSCHDSAETAAHVDSMTLPGTFDELCNYCHGDGTLFSIESSHASP
jgi:predicted CXXCH cytochrome family protein